MGGNVCQCNHQVPYNFGSSLYRQIDALNKALDNRNRIQSSDKILP